MGVMVSRGSVIMCSCNICLCVFLTPSLSDIVDIVSATPSQPPSEAAKDGLDSDPMGGNLSVAQNSFQRFAAH